MQIDKMKAGASMTDFFQRMIGIHTRWRDALSRQDHVALEEAHGKLWSLVLQSDRWGRDMAHRSPRKQRCDWLIDCATSKRKPPCEACVKAAHDAKHATPPKRKQTRRTR